MISKSSTRPCRVATALLLLASVCGGAAAPSAASADPSPQPEPEFSPAPPLPDDTTWLRLTSGEWLKGRIRGLSEGSLEFASDALGTLHLSWSKVEEIHSNQSVQMALEDGRVVSGVLRMADGRIRWSDDQATPLGSSEVLSITTGGTGGRDLWSGDVVAGLNIRSGNTEQTDFTGRANAVRRTPRDRVTLGYLGNISDTEEARVTDNHRASGEWARLKSKRFFWTPLYGEYFRDPFQNIADRVTLGTGVGYMILDTGRTTWELRARAAYQWTSFDQVPDGEPSSADTPALLVGTGYDHDLTGWIDYFLDFDFRVVDEASGTYSHHLITGLKLDLVGSLDFDVSWVWDRIEDPQPDADGLVPERDDYRLVFGLGLSF